MKGFVIKWFAGGVIRELVEGKYGPVPQRVYLALLGRKTYIAFALALFGAAAATFGNPQVGQIVMQIGGAGVIIGIVDKGWRDERGPREEIAAMLHEVMSYGPALAALSSILVRVILWTGNPHAGEWVNTIDMAGASIAAAASYLAAYCAEPPAIPKVRR